jgi:hypothetical protein
VAEAATPTSARMLTAAPSANVVMPRFVIGPSFLARRYRSLYSSWRRMGLPSWSKSSVPMPHG